MAGGGWQLSKPPLQRHTLVLFLRLHSVVLEGKQSLSEVHTPLGRPAINHKAIMTISTAFLAAMQRTELLKVLVTGYWVVY